MPTTDPLVTPEQIAAAQQYYAPSPASPPAPVAPAGLAAASVPPPPPVPAPAPPTPPAPAPQEAPGGYAYSPTGAVFSNVPRLPGNAPHVLVTPLPSESRMPGDANPILSPSVSHEDQVRREAEYADRLRAAMAGKPRPAPTPVQKAPLTAAELTKAMAAGAKKTQ